MTQAKIIAGAFIIDEQMHDHTGSAIEWITESSTDLPADALGEAAALCLQKAWKTGIDPAITDGFHLRIRFE